RGRSDAGRTGRGANPRADARDRRTEVYGAGEGLRVDAAGGRKTVGRARASKMTWSAVGLGMRYAAGGEVCGAAADASRAEAATCPRRRVRLELPFSGRFSARKYLHGKKRPGIGTSDAGCHERAANRPLFGTFHAYC